MKIKASNQKGITLVALIITIIVLLILAVVTINAVNEGSLFSYANNAARTYSEKAEEENSLITGYISKIGEYDKDNNGDGTEIDLSGTYYSYDQDPKQTLTVIKTGDNTYTGTNTYGTFEGELRDGGATIYNITQDFPINLFYNGDTVYFVLNIQPYYFTNNSNNMFPAAIPSGNYVTSDNTKRIIISGETWKCQDSSDNGQTWTDAQATYWRGDHCGIAPGSTNTALFVGYIDNDYIEYMSGQYENEKITLNGYDLILQQ